MIAASLAAMQAGFQIEFRVADRVCRSFRFFRLAGLVVSTFDVRRIAGPVLERTEKFSNERVTFITAADLSQQPGAPVR